MAKVRNDILKIQTVLGYSVNTTGLVKQSIALNSQLDFLQDYATFADDLLVLNYGDYLIRKNITPENVKLYVANMLMSEKYNLETLIGTLDLEYNPIENYNMVEEGTDNRTLDYAQRKSDTDFNSGTKKTSGQNKHSVAPYNNTTMYQTEQDDMSSSQDSYKDTTSRTDSAHIDKDNLSHRLTRSGNVGVTTSQQMIQAQRDLSNLNISETIAKLVVNAICKGVQGTI